MRNVIVSRSTAESGGRVTARDRVIGGTTANTCSVVGSCVRTVLQPNLMAGQSLWLFPMNRSPDLPILRLPLPPPVRPRSSPLVPGVSRPRPDGYPRLIPTLSRSVPFISRGLWQLWHVSRRSSGAFANRAKLVTRSPAHSIFRPPPGGSAVLLKTKAKP
jgi:hypothetical protein